MCIDIIIGFWAGNEVREDVTNLLVSSPTRLLRKKEDFVSSKPVIFSVCQFQDPVK